jgi:hypothetical protein
MVLVVGIKDLLLQTVVYFRDFCNDGNNLRECEFIFIGTLSL